MPECRSHTIDLNVGDPYSFGFIAPLGHGNTHFRRNALCFSRFEIEIVGNPQSQIDGRGCILYVDRRAEDSGFNVKQYRVQIVGGRKPLVP